MKKILEFIVWTIKWTRKLRAQIRKFRTQISALSVLIAINSIIKILQFEFIYSKVDWWAHSYILMFISSAILRYILIIIYDLINKDYFLLELFKKIKSGEMEVQNRLIERIINLKASGRFYLFIGLASGDPVVMNIYYRGTDEKWNNPSLRVLSFFLFSCFLCSFFLMGVFVGVSVLLNETTLICFLKIFYFLKLVYIL